MTKELQVKAMELAAAIRAEEKDWPDIILFAQGVLSNYLSEKTRVAQERKLLTAEEAVESIRNARKNWLV